MIIEELREGGGRSCEVGDRVSEEGRCGWLAVDAKRAAVGVGARILFYPSVACNVFRNLFEPEFHWWDRVDEHVLLGAVPFPGDVPRMKGLGVSAVVTLTEPYETLVPTSLYLTYGIDNIVLPTRDYIYAPSYGNLCKGVDFIHRNASCEKMTYVHCKAGRGRSTTVVLCYLVQYKQMTPSKAYDYVKLRRPRVFLAPAQWQAIQEFYHCRVKQTVVPRCMRMTSDPPTTRQPLLIGKDNFIAFDDSMVVVISESDLQGYDSSASCLDSHDVPELSVVYQVRFMKKAVLARISYLWHRHRNDAASKHGHLRQDGCSAEFEAGHLGNGHPCLGVVVN